MPFRALSNTSTRTIVRKLVWAAALAAGTGTAADLAAQTPGSQPPPSTSLPSAQSLPTAQQNGASPGGSSFQGSVPSGQSSPQTLDLTLDDAIQRGLRNNLGIILSGTQTASARAQRLSQLQNLLPSVDAHIQESVMQVNLAAEGLRGPGIPTIVGPFGYTDLRGTLAWSVVDVKSLRQYMASKHDFAAAQLTADDARQMVILTVGNAYLLVLADETQVESVDAQVKTSEVSLNQAVESHKAGTAPLLDELRARVDTQTLQQLLIVSQNTLDKDRLALARTIGLPLDQKYNLVDREPYAAFDQVDVNQAIQQAHANRKDLQAILEQTKSAQEMRKAATAERYPKLTTNADYGLIGVNLAHSHGTVDATGMVSVPLFKEYALRGDAEQTQSKLDTAKAQLSDANAQVEADVRDALLDLKAAQQSVEVAKSSVDLANEALSEAQQRYKAGVSDNLAVSQAQRSVAQSNEQYVTSLYRHNIAKLSLARALGAAENYKSYLGGK
ncbi:MAG TPA: TolC family protein [Terracidiphilus sp.]|nr:TolC family protein [Terracidiphilus sp.]